MVQALVALIRGSDDVGKRLVVLPAFETLPFKSKGNQEADDLALKVADFALEADKDAIKVSAGLTGSCTCGDYAIIPGRLVTLSA
jgi:hypothetical protein